LRFLSRLWVGLDGLKHPVSVAVVVALGKEIPGRELRLQLT
jgi:hypothetical protein